MKMAGLRACLDELNEVMITQDRINLLRFDE